MLNHTTCCGIKEFHRIKNIFNPTTFIQEVYDLVVKREDKTAIIWFSDTTERINGYRIQKYIEDNKLGKIISTNPTSNKRSGHDIILWAWEIDNIALAMWETPHRQNVKGYSRGAVRLWKIKRFFRNLKNHLIPKLTLEIPETQEIAS